MLKSNPALEERLYLSFLSVPSALQGVFFSVCLLYVCFLSPNKREALSVGSVPACPLCLRFSLLEFFPHGHSLIGKSNKPDQHLDVVQLV